MSPTDISIALILDGRCGADEGQMTASVSELPV